MKIIISTSCVSPANFKRKNGITIKINVQVTEFQTLYISKYAISCLILVKKTVPNQNIRHTFIFILNHIFFFSSKTETNAKSLYLLDSLDLRGMLGERHLGGVRHFSINSSAFVLDGTGSATNNRSVLPSSTPLPQPPATRKPYKRKSQLLPLV